MNGRAADILKTTAILHSVLIERAGEIEDIGQCLADVAAAGGTIYVMGNGGSACDAQHMAGEMVGRFLRERRPLPCMAFSADSAVLTAIANDYSVDDVFSKQVEAFAREGDAVLGISTSGNSPNVLKALDVARRRGTVTVGLTGKGGGAMLGRCDLCFVVPSDHTPRIQEAHATIIHIWCGIIEDILFGAEGV